MNTRKYHIVCPNGTTEDVRADYYRLENGHLIFRNSKDRANSYPETIAIYAPFQWHKVTLATEG